VRIIEYKVVVKPSVDYLERCGTLMLDTRGMASFFGISTKAIIGARYVPSMERA
jgi:hypothetical protein